MVSTNGDCIRIPSDDGHSAQQDTSGQLHINPYKKEITGSMSRPVKCTNNYKYTQIQLA